MEIPASTSFFIGVSSILSLAILVWLAYLTLSLRRLKKYQGRIRDLAEEGNLALSITNSLEAIDALKKELGDVSDRQSELKEFSEQFVQKVGLVRFNAFNDLGGELSFAAALLNNHGDGVVISSIYGAGDSRTYAKLVKGKKSNHRLSGEEEQAIAVAFEPKHPT